MNAASSKHRVLAVSMLTVGALSACAWLLAVRPQRLRVEEGREAQAQKQKSLRQRGWSVDRQRLQDLLDQRLRVLDGAGTGDPGLKLRAEQVRQHATAMFGQLVQGEFQTPEAFVRDASNIDFREAFDKLQRRFAAEGVWVAPEVLGLAEDSSVPYSYQLLLQVWTVERLLDLALANHLRVMPHPKVRVRTGSGEKAAAQVSVQPLVAYYLEEGSPVPCLLGIPVRLRLSGQVGEVREFVLSLTSAGNFLPPVNVELYAEDPRLAKGRPPESGGPGRVELDVTCSAFFAFPGGDAPARPPTGRAGGTGPGGA